MSNLDLLPGVSDAWLLILAVLLVMGAASKVFRRRPPSPSPPSLPSVGPPSAPPLPKAEAPSQRDWFERLRAGLSLSRGGLWGRVESLWQSRKQIDEDLFRQLEETLIGADVGMRVTQRLLDSIRDRADRNELADGEVLRRLLVEEASKILEGKDLPLASSPETGPLVFMVIGVNGAGKTTTIGKLAARYIREGKKVVVAAGDTFRAAAIEQLEVWAERAGAGLIRQQEGSDPAAVIHDAVKAAVARKADVLIADTAGRLHTKAPLMEELKKVRRVMEKALPGAPHETLLVLDANTGQNAVHQARLFHEAVGVTGLVMTKLDGTAKGGVVLQICDELALPVKLIGIGEKVDDLRDFDSEDFVRALFG